MLKEIIVDQFVIAKHIEISLADGFNAFTGETGAGKTLLINAILFGIGHSIPKEAMGDEETRPYVRLVFDVIPDAIRQELEQQGFEIENNEDFILERTFSKKGTNKTHINGQLAPLSLYKSMGKALIDFHGQRETGSLLLIRKQLQYLDEYIGPEAEILRKQINQCKNHLMKIIQERIDIEEREKEYTLEKELLEYQMQEYDAINFQEGEWEEAISKRDKLEHFQVILANLQKTLGLLSGNDDSDQSAQNNIQQSMHDLFSIQQFSPVALHSYQSLETIDSILKDITHDIHAELSSLDSEYDDRQLSFLHERIAILNTIRTRYGPSFSEIQKTIQQKRDRLQFLGNQELSLGNLLQEQTETRDLLSRLCNELHAKREEASVLLSRDIEQHLHQLSMPDAQFHVLFSFRKSSFETPNHVLFKGQPIEVSESGFDIVHFHFQANAGLPLMDMQHIASGGELSRIMLAIKVSLRNAKKRESVYVFDEIDAGINGVTGNEVGAKLKQLSVENQTLCITHLPQIAAYSDNHFYIEKSKDKTSVISSIRLLDSEEKIKEIARMMGGDIYTETALKHAKEILSHAK